jgi:hypothetical protein
LIKFVLLNSIDYKVLFYFLFYISQVSKIRTRNFQKVFYFHLLFFIYRSCLLGSCRCYFIL